ncbi:MAG: RecX family transcriptional regulator [Lewinellaceae bacterium]|nr:RecX family transcriptional regulator [Lewinellaceae bacterium]
MAFEKQPEKTWTTDEALARMENYCAYRERCPQEVRRKMAELGLEGETAEQIWQVLIGEGFVNEERFARAFAGGKFRVNHWGRVRIRLELRQRAIASDLIVQALETIDEAEYLAVLLDTLEKKRRQYRSDPNARAKTAAALIRAGFEPELVFRHL